MIKIIHYIPAIVSILISLIIVLIYNNLVSINNQCDEAWSNMETELKRRYDLIPRLVSTVKEYIKYEKSLLEEIVRLRERALNNQSSIISQALDETALQQTLNRLIVRLEAYPELKASHNFLELQRELSNTEDRIQAALRFYNGNVRENNNAVKQFPSSVIAWTFKFKRKAFFRIDEPLTKLPPDLNF